MAQKYPLEIENWGEDVYILASRGHHDFETFMREVRKHYPTWPMGHPEHLWMRAVPDPTGDCICRYVQDHGPRTGSFPVTYTSEDYSPGRYFLPEEMNEDNETIRDQNEGSSKNKEISEVFRGRI